MTTPPCRVSGRLADSRLALPGTTNVRDLAGYPAGAGLRVGASRLLRGEVLARPGGDELQGRFDATHAQPFADLGLRTVVDLRSDEETSRTPSAWASATGAAVVRLPIAEGGEGADTDYVRRLLSREMAEFGEVDMTEFLAATLRRQARTFAAVVTVLADRERLPALVHCSAGKDRTGLAVALVLELLGTPRELVVEDYALTGVLRPDRVLAYADRFAAAGVDPEAARVLFESPAGSMRAALAQLDREHGSVEAYLVDLGGLSPSVPERLRASLLVAQPEQAPAG